MARPVIPNASDRNLLVFDEALAGLNGTGSLDAHSVASNEIAIGTVSMLTVKVRAGVYSKFN